MWPLVFAHVPALFLADTFSLSLSLSLSLCVSFQKSTIFKYFKTIIEINIINGLLYETQEIS